MSEIVLLGKPYTVRRATLADEFRRARLEKEAEAREYADEDIRKAALQYPRIAASTDNRLSLDDFLALPSTEVDVWFFASSAENPRWFPAAQDESGPNA